MTLSMLRQKEYTRFMPPLKHNPRSGSFWLTDHSLAGHTTVNGNHVADQVELHNGDMIRFGKAQPFVFERRVFFPWKKHSNSDEASVGRSEPKSTTFPILVEKSTMERNPILCHHPSNRNHQHIQVVLWLRRFFLQSRMPSSYDIRKRSVIDQARLHSAKYARGCVGNNLLQRVVRLQDELARKNLEIDELKRQRCPHLEEPSSSFKQNSHHLPYIPETHSSMGRNFELEAYRSFIAMVAAKVRSFNDVYVLRHFFKNLTN
ncbi:hypothetical protein KIN20_010544 [Parelaphostrongylus tenuis]|uniref:FHA domain-containing protein n=1 Tax=Parelaphostrongylus tenuis TaxID=148309 RepID=A0AAD5QLW5_PARTN|nr:hypothetical protein KIN20_010544 [Parelaphostrongylus tenuis]